MTCSVSIALYTHQIELRLSAVCHAVLHHGIKKQEATGQDPTPFRVGLQLQHPILPLLL